MRTKVFLILISTIFSTSTFGQSGFNNFLKKFKPLSYPCLIDTPYCSSNLKGIELEKFLNIDVDDNYDTLVLEDIWEPSYCAGYVLKKREFITIFYSRNSKTGRGQDLQDIFIATFSNEGKLIDKKELGSFNDYNEGFDTLTTLYTDKSTIEITPSNHLYVTNIHTGVLLDEEGDKHAINSNAIKTAYYIYEGRIDLTYKENLSDTTSIRAKFVDFDMGDAVYYDFETESGKDIGFGGKEINNIQFAELLDESEMNSDNQGWGTNKELQGKWFNITYIERQQPMYISGPIGTVKIIIKAELSK